jgi:hypothetical protein
MLASSGSASANPVRVRSGFSVARAVRLTLPARLRIASTRGASSSENAMTSAGRSSSARLEHVQVGLGRDELFEDGKVAFFGVVLDGVERGEPERRILGGELKLHQRGRDHALHAAIGAKLRDLAAGPPVPSTSPVVISISVSGSASGSST